MIFPKTIFNQKVGQFWGVLLLSILIWHSIHTIIYWHPQFLLSMCYAIILLICIGLIFNVPTLLGLSFFWIFPGFFFWLCYAISYKDWEISGVLCHSLSIVAAIFVIRCYSLPRLSVLFCFIACLLFQVISWLFTVPAYNINGAFSVYFPELKPYMPDVLTYQLAKFGGIVIYFLIMQFFWLRRHQKKYDLYLSD